MLTHLDNISNQDVLALMIGEKRIIACWSDVLLCSKTLAIIAVCLERTKSFLSFVIKRSKPYLSNY